LVKNVVEVCEGKYSNKEDQQEDFNVLEHLDNHPDEAGSGPKDPEEIENFEPDEKASHSSNHKNISSDIESPRTAIEVLITRKEEIRSRKFHKNPLLMKYSEGSFSNCLPSK